MDFRPEEFAGKSVKLSSPVGQGQLEIWWPTTKDKEILQARVKELEDTVEIVTSEITDFKNSLLLTKLQEFRAYRSFESAQNLAKLFNRNVNTQVKLNRGTQKFHAQMKRPINKEALDHVLKQVYRASVTDPTLLNKYQSFTSETYGETNFSQMDKIIQTLNWTEDDVFVDLGSGIGSLVMQVSAMTPAAKSVGIEIQPTPCIYAKNMDVNFKKIMKWYGYRHTNYDLFSGDFTKTEYKNTRTDKDDSFNWKTEATIIFVNNYAFSEDLNLKLRRVFGEMNIGTQIISTKAFCPVDFKINDRNAGKDIGCFMRVYEMDSITDGFSWTNNVVQVYKHVIDHSLLADYYASKTRKAHGGGSATSASSSTKDRSSSNSPIDFVETREETVKSVSHADKSQKRSLKHRPLKKMSKDKLENRSRENSPAQKRGPKTGSKRARSTNLEAGYREALETFNVAQVKSYSKKTTKRSEKYLKPEEKERVPKDRASIAAFANFDEQMLDRAVLNETSRLKALRSELAKARSKKDQISNKNRALPMPQHTDNIPALPQHANAVSHAAYETIAVHGSITPKGQQPRPSIIMKPYHNQNKEMEPYSAAVQRAKPNPSPHSVPLSPHSTKSSPSSDVNQSRVNGHHISSEKGQIRDSVGPPPEVNSLVASHYPIHLQPQNPAARFPTQQPPPNGVASSPTKNAKRRRSADIDRPKVVITPSSQMSTSPQTKQILHQMPPQILIPGAYPFQNGLHRGSIPSREPAPHDPKIYGGLGGMIATSSALSTSAGPHHNGTTDATSLGDQRASVPRHLVNFSPQPGMIHPSMVSLLSQGYNLAQLGVPAPFFPFNPRQQQSMQRAATSSAAAVNHHGVIKQSQPIQHTKTKNTTPHNK
ncbi:unnamed protein product [Oikopleura dioica]|uniref:Histone-lysine N-methyltransferase, H3 lysine-79 specific n=1 Tax=Oikopleura dioica TaxID=34765 RepID=E4WQH1_OIKDI|nr:unnamed protein product [Oikopleura dioica]